MLGVLPFGEDPDLSANAVRMFAQLLPPWRLVRIARLMMFVTSQLEFKLLKYGNPDIAKCTPVYPN